MTKYYGQDKETDQAVALLISREVLACQSLLVDALLSLDTSEDSDGLYGQKVGGTRQGTTQARMLDNFSYDEIENLYPDPSEWSAQECRDWCEEQGIYEDLEELDELRDCVVENSEAAEIFEWWLVTTWAASKLREQGQPILTVGSDIWWGRTTTGQSIALAPTWYDIHATVKP